MPTFASQITQIICVPIATAGKNHELCAHKNSTNMKKVFIGIDNGVSGSIACISDDRVSFLKTPVVVQQDYTKKKSNVTRIDVPHLSNLLANYTRDYKSSDIIVAVERPMVNPQRFIATASALRAWEATLIVLEHLKLPYQIIDSKEWQKSLLPKGVSGVELKKASLDVGNRLFPEFREEKHPDRDSLLIAEYLRKINT